MRKIFSALLAGLLLAGCLALPAAAEAYGAPDITPATKMEDIRQNPSILGAGIFTYSLDQYRPLDRMYWNGQTLEKFSNRFTAWDTAKGLNFLIEQYNAGQQVTYPLYTKEEIRKDWTRRDAELYYFPAEQPNGKYLLIIPGNAMVVSAELREGVSSAWNLHEMGYTCFVLRYRIGAKASNNAPLEDVARAVRYITDHAEQFQVQPEEYAILGYSSGGQIAGLFASDKLGYKTYGLNKPGALLLGYPVNTFLEFKPVFNMIIDPFMVKQNYYDLTLSNYITPDYPPTYHWYGKNDITLKTMCLTAQGPRLENALQKNGIVHHYTVYSDAPHAIGAGKGTDAEGWLQDAVAFWEEQTA